MLACVKPLNYSGVKNRRPKSYSSFAARSATAARRGHAQSPVQSHLFFTQNRETNSPIQGRGLFAKTDIEKGEVVVVKGGYVLTNSQRDEIGKELGPSEIQITEHLFIGPTSEDEREGGMMHLNHSCEPNLGLQGQIVFIALRDIRANEELTVDYAMTDDEEYEMQCKCGAETCRGVITGADWRKPEIQRKYDGYFSWFIQRRIDAVDLLRRRATLRFEERPG